MCYQYKESAVSFIIRDAWNVNDQDWRQQYDSDNCKLVSESVQFHVPLDTLCHFQDKSFHTIIELVLTSVNLWSGLVLEMAAVTKPVCVKYAA